MPALPKGYLSHSALDRFESCRMKYFLMDVQGHSFWPVRRLERNKTDHKVVLKEDLGYKIQTGHNRADSELSEIYRTDIEQLLPLFREDRTDETPADKYAEDSVKYFDRILMRTKDFRHAVKPAEVEQEVLGEIGGIPIKGFPDLIADETINNRIWDWKRLGSGSVTKGLAGKDRQMVTYSILKEIPDVGRAQVVENKEPKLELDEGQVTKEEVNRVTLQYQSAAADIETCVKTGLFAPVNHGDKRKAWVCSREWCGAWPADARDFRTGESVACPFGERSEVRV